MAGTQHVQLYLEKHKIGILFEELMGKVIADQPDDPVQYLIRSLERKSNRQTLRRSTDGERMAVPKERSSYEKPWQSNSKKGKGRDSSAERASRKSLQSRPEWNNKTKTESQTFDDLWDSKDMSRSRGQRSGSPARKSAAHVSWGDGEEDLFTSHGYSGPYRQNEADELAGEFSVAKETTSKQQQHKLTSVPKGKSQQRDSEKHKQELQRLVLNRKSAEDSGIEDDCDLQRDEEAVELMESLDDLRGEGVNSVKSSGGVSVRSSVRETGSSEPAVRVSICARCAKVMSGESSEPVRRASGYGELDDSDTETRDLSRPHSAVRFTPDTALGSDEEFESVSQVTGPRRPVWQDDSDDESVTPRKGAHMFQSSTVPSKGRHMYSPTQSPDHTSIKQTAVKVAQSANFSQSAGTRGPGGELRGHAAFNKTWSPELDLSEKPVETPKDEGTTRTAHSLTTGGSGWKVPNYDDDNASSFYGSSGQKGQKDMSGPY